MIQLKLRHLLLLLIPTSLLPTSFAIWPLPQLYAEGNTTLCLDPSFFIRIDIQPHRSVPQDVREAVKRSRGNIVSSRHAPVSHYPESANLTELGIAPCLSELVVRLSNSTPIDKRPLIAEEAVLPLEDRDESYELVVPDDGTSGVLVASTVLGLLRGLTTFEQLWYMEQEENTPEKSIRDALYLIPLIGPLLSLSSQSSLSRFTPHRLPILYTPSAPYQIFDRPTFPWRGLLLDTSRNFLPLPKLRDLLDTMSFVKLNMFHWHITDSHSWPLHLAAHPELARKGAYSPKEIYTEEDIQELSFYAAERGIDILLEIDLPGHTTSLGASHPGLIACNGWTPWSDYANEPPAGQLRFMLEEAGELVGGILKAAAGLTGGRYIGLGGDEVNLRCYAEDDVSQQALTDGNITLEAALDEFVALTTRSVGNKTAVMWQEIITSHDLLKIPNETIALSWRTHTEKMQILNKGHRVVDMPHDPLYLDCGVGSWVSNSESGQSWCDPYKTWERIHSYDPLDGVSEDLQSLVLGGQAALWTEQTDEQNLDAKLWPRAAAAAEVFWTGSNRSDVNAARERMNDLRNRLVGRGVRAAALQPEWCIRNPGRC